jgi:hypothetical protein
MAHFLVVAAIVLGAWTLLALPLGMLVGRRLRRVAPPAPAARTARQSRALRRPVRRSAAGEGRTGPAEADPEGASSPAVRRHVRGR